MRDLLDLILMFFLADNVFSMGENYLFLAFRQDLSTAAIKLLQWRFNNYYMQKLQ